MIDEKRRAYIENLAWRGIVPMQIFDRLEKNEYVFCGEEPDDFRDTVAIREFAINGTCQRCQDLTLDDIFPAD